MGNRRGGIPVRGESRCEASEAGPGLMKPISLHRGEHQGHMLDVAAEVSLGKQAVLF